MKTIRKILVFLLIIFLVGTVGGTLSYYLRPLFFDKYLAPGENFKTTWSIGLFISFIVYSLLLLVSTRFKGVTFTKLWVQGLFCLIVVALLFLLITSNTFGASLVGLGFTITSLGLPNFILPWLSKAFNK